MDLLHRAQSQVPRSQSESSEQWPWSKQLLFVIVHSSELSSVAVGLSVAVDKFPLDVYIYNKHKHTINVQSGSLN